MYIIYTVNMRTGSVDLCCYTNEYEKGFNALDDYAVAKFFQKMPNYPQKENPLIDESLKTRDGYYLEESKDHVNGYNDSERILLVKRKNNKIKVLRYFQVGYVDKYIDDYLGERTSKVIELEEDEQNQVTEILDDKDELSDYENQSSDEFSDEEYNDPISNKMDQIS